MVITIDGAAGGGSILRLAAPLIISQQEKGKIVNIRKTRSTPGLRPQHLTGIVALCDIAGYDLVGGKVGSQVIELQPKETGTKTHKEISLDTAASVSLIIQLFTNYCFATKNKVTIDFNGGGTHTKWSPNFDYLTMITKPNLAKFGVDLQIDMQKVGYYPKGGAKGSFSLIPEQSKQVNLQRENDYRLKVISRATNDLKGAEVAIRQIRGLTREPDEKIIRYNHSDSTGTSITAAVYNDTNHLGAARLGERGVPAEKVGKYVDKQLDQLEQQQGSVDKYMADQLLLPLVFTSTGSSYTFSEITDHIDVNRKVIDTILPNTLEINEHEDYFQAIHVEKNTIS